MEQRRYRIYHTAFLAWVAIAASAVFVQAGQTAADAVLSLDGPWSLATDPQPQPPAEAVAGAIKASQDYDSGLMLAVYPLGAGRFVLNTLNIRNQLAAHPAAGRLLLNFLRYTSNDANKPLAPLPSDFDRQLDALGFK